MDWNSLELSSENTAGGKSSISVKWMQIILKLQRSFGVHIRVQRVLVCSETGYILYFCIDNIDNIVFMVFVRSGGGGI